MKINLDSVFNLEPEQAVGFFADKGLKPSFDWRDMVGQEHDTAFTVAKMMDNDLLETTQGLLKQAIKDGQSFGAFKEQLIPKLVEKGWWGRAEMLDPLTGMVSEVQLGSVSRLETVFRTNMQSAYGAGKWESIERNAKTTPYLMYVAVDDGRTREEHAQFDGLVLPWDHPFWKTHYPPNGWNCRCGVIQLSAAEVKEMGLKVSKNPPPIKQSKWMNPRTGKTHTILDGTDPGWNHNPGVERVKALKVSYQDKIEAMPAAMKKAALKGDAQTQVSAKAAAIADKAKYSKIDPQVTSAATAKKALQQAESQKALDKLSGYKKKVLDGKLPSPSETAAFKALTPDEQKAFLAKIEKDMPTAVTAPKKLDQDSLPAISASKGVDDKPTAPAPQVAVTDELAKDIIDEILDDPDKNPNASNWLNMEMSKGMVINKTNAAKILAQMESAIGEVKTKTTAGKGLAIRPVPPLTPKPSGGLNESNLTQIGGQKGSNEGGLYRDTTTGKTYYIKVPQTPDHAYNEVIAGRLYQAAGIDTPNMQTLSWGNGRIAVASEIIDDLSSGGASTNWKTIKGAHQGFVADAWLANWDVVGLDFDNLLIKGKSAVRLDTGGALFFRAQGAKKPGFGAVVTELDTLIDKSINPQSAAVFNGITNKSLLDGAKAVAAITDKQIDDIVKSVAMSAPMKKELAETLKARRDYIAEKLLPKKKAAIPAAIKKQAQAQGTSAINAKIKALEDSVNKKSKANGKQKAVEKMYFEDEVMEAMFDIADLVDESTYIAIEKYLDDAAAFLGSAQASTKAYPPFKGKINLEPKYIATLEKQIAKSTNNKPGSMGHVTAQDRALLGKKANQLKAVDEAIISTETPDLLNAARGQASIDDFEYYTKKKLNGSKLELSATTAYTGQSYKEMNGVARALLTENMDMEKVIANKHKYLDIAHMTDAKIRARHEANSAVNNFILRNEMRADDVIPTLKKTYHEQSLLNIELADTSYQLAVAGRTDITNPVFRGMRSFGATESAKAGVKLDFYTPGNKIRFNSTTSTAVTLESGWDGDIQILIKNARGVYFDPLSAAKDELEFIIRAGSVFEVEEVITLNKKGKKTKFTVLRMLDDEEVPTTDILEYATTD